MNSQRPGDQQQVADLRLLAVLNPLNRASVNLGQFGESFLGEAEVQPLDAHAVADRSSGVEDPLLIVCGVHDSHAPPKIILCPQQICGIL